MPCVKRCCCCVNLRLGGITMGVMTLALSAFSIVPMAISFVHREFLSQVVTHMRREFKDDEQNGGEEKQVAFWGVVSNALSNDGQSNLPPKDDEEVVRMTEIMFIFFLVCIGILLVYLVCSILLIFGAAKGKRWLLLPWIILTFLLLLAYLGGTITSIIELGYRFEILLLLGFAIVEVAIGFYLWVCIVSLFQVLGLPEFRNGDDWELKPRFTTSYNSVPTQD